MRDNGSEYWPRHGHRLTSAVNGGKHHDCCERHGFAAYHRLSSHPSLFVGHTCSATEGVRKKKAPQALPSVHQLHFHNTSVHRQVTTGRQQSSARWDHQGSGAQRRLQITIEDYCTAGKLSTYRFPHWDHSALPARRPRMLRRTVAQSFHD